MSIPDLGRMWRGCVAGLRRTSIRRRIFLLLALNLAVICLLALLMWRYLATEVEFQRRIESLLSLDRALDRIQDDSGRLQRFIREYLARPEPWTQAAVNELAARLDRRISEGGQAYGDGNKSLLEAQAAMRRLLGGFDKLVSLHPEIVATYDNTVLQAGREVSELFSVLKGALLTERSSAAAASASMAHEAFVEAMLNLNAFQFRPDADSAARARRSLARASGAVPVMMSLMKADRQKQVLEVLDERLGVIQRGFDRLQEMYREQGDILSWEVDRNAAALTRLVDAILRDNEEQQARLKRDFERDQYVVMVTLLGIALLVVALGTMMGWAIVQSITQPLAELMGTVEALASGELERSVSGQAQPDEVGALARTLQAFKDHALARRDAENSMRELQVELRRSLAEREGILRSTLVGIAHTVNRNLLWANDTFARMLGYTREELLGQSSLVYFPDRRSWEDFGAAAYPTLAAGQPYVTEQQMLRKDGTLVWVELYGNAVDTRDPEKGTIWTAIDVTGRRKAADNLQIALEKQRELAELKSRFVSMASHEFRTPLTTILSSSELLRLYGERLPAVEKVEIMGSIDTAVRRMTSLLDDVLVIGRMEGGTLEFAPTRFRLRTYCEALLDEVQQSEIRQGRDGRTVKLRMSGDPEVHLDGRLLHHILANLLSNAIKYSPVGAVIEIEVGVQPEAVKFRVCDCGIGIPDEDLQHLFEAFRRGRNVGNIGGTGLGLVVVKNYVDMHGGRVEVSSTVGKGSCFTVILPQGGPAPGPDS